MTRFSRRIPYRNLENEFLSPTYQCLLFCNACEIEFEWTKEQLEDSGVEVIYESKLATDTPRLIITPTKPRNMVSTDISY